MKFSHLRINGFSDCHCQGIAIDNDRKFMYFSFTTCLIKTDIEGRVIGSVKGIIGHLGCLALNQEDGRVYASLEYNDDEIGKGILRKLDKKANFSNRFYVAVFDVEKITQSEMDAEKDGIMTAVCLNEVVEDYNYPGHKYGCSGIDGITFAPAPGESDGNYLYVAYGIYGDTKRNDNDHQILLRYDPVKLKNYELPLKQDALHNNGPEKPLNKYFVYTGNTNYGIQNLEYDKDNKCLFAAVYKGRKFRFPNYSMFAVDISKTAVCKRLRGLNEKGDMLFLKKLSFFKKRGKISGSHFSFGSTGMISLGNNMYIFSEEFKDKCGHGTVAFSYRIHKRKGFVKEEIDI